MAVSVISRKDHAKPGPGIYHMRRRGVVDEDTVGARRDEDLAGGEEGGGVVQANRDQGAGGGSGVGSRVVQLHGGQIPAIASPDDEDLVRGEQRGGVGAVARAHGTCGFPAGSRACRQAGEGARL